MSATAIDLNEPASAKSAGTDLARSSLALLDEVSEGAITDLAALEQAVRERQQIGAMRKRVEEFFRPLKQLAHQLHRSLCDREGEILAPLDLRDRNRATAISAFKLAEDARRREQERIDAEALRLQREQQAADEAAALESAGDHSLAASVVAEAIAAPAPVVALPDLVKQVEGLKFRRNWKWRYASNDKARAAALIPRAFLMPDEAKIGAFARSMKDSAQIPGIEFFYEDVPVR